MIWTLLKNFKGAEIWKSFHYKAKLPGDSRITIFLQCYSSHIDTGSLVKVTSYSIDHKRKIDVSSSPNNPDSNMNIHNEITQIIFTSTSTASPLLKVLKKPRNIIFCMQWAEH